MTVSSAGVIVAFFSPSGFELPRHHFAKTLTMLAALDVPVLSLQACKHDQKPVQHCGPRGNILEAVFWSDHALFLKENLWNIGAKMLDVDRLCFLDADVVFSEAGWLDRAFALLDECDIAQPYETACWLDRNGLPTHSKPSSASAIASGQEPKPGTHHPGFAWVMTRDAFDRLGGWYERHPAGGADTAFAYCLDERWKGGEFVVHAAEDMQMWHTKSFQAYQSNASAAGLKVGFLQGVTAYHRWHGDLANRQYMTRCRHMPQMVEGEYPIRTRHDGLIEWECDEHSAAAKAFFDSRREDG